MKAGKVSCEGLTPLPAGGEHGHHLPTTITQTLYLPQGSGPQCCHSEHPLHILYYGNFLLHDLCFLHLGTCYMSILDCCCSGKTHIYCPQSLRVCTRDGETHCRPGTAAAAARPEGVFFSFSECSFLTMIKKWVTLSSQPQHVVRATITVTFLKTGFKSWQHDIRSCK